MMTLRIGQLLLLATSSLLLCCTQELTEILTIEVCKTCHPNATCIEKDKKYSCMCNFGLIGNGRTQCLDKNECQIGAQKICGEHTECHNTHGSYYCICLKGYRPSNNHDNFIPNDGTFCTDINECEVPDICGENAKCKDIPGGYECFCNDGYRLQNGSEHFQADGDPDLCKAVDCGPPPAVPHSEVVLLGNTTFGSYVAYTCMLGFHAKKGQNTSMCTANGTWEDVGLVCQAVDCGPPPAVPHSKVVLLGNTTFGSYVAYTCMLGFHAKKGQNTSMCTANGTWEDVGLVCQAVDCGQPPFLQNMHTDIMSLTTFGSKAIYRCDDGFIAENIQDNTATCSDNGSWHGVLMKCKAVDCGIPQALPNTVIHLLNSTAYRSKVKFVCSKGFIAESGSNTSVCNASGYWKGANLVCKAVDCGLPQALPNTVIHLFNSTAYRSKVTFVCSKGFIAESGSNTSVCNASGHWEGANLVCKVADCGPPPSIQNAMAVRLQNTTYGSTLVFKCLLGYIMASGNDIATCNEDGEWNGADLSCREINCGQPPSLLNTNRVWNGSTNLGSEVQYTCLKGFYNPNIWHVSRCTFNESWVNATFLCTEVDCGLPLTIEHADWLWNNESTVGSYIYYKCKPGFRDNGERNFSQCLKNSTWEALNLTCTEKEDLIGNLEIFNETCMNWTKSTDFFGREIRYKISIFGVRLEDKEFVDEKTFNYTTDDENPFVCLELLPDTNYTITITALFPEIPTAVLTVTMQTSRKHIFGNLISFNDSCLTWTGSSSAKYSMEVYTVFIQGKTWNPQGLLQNIMFNFSTEESTPILCLELPPGAEYLINITESSTELSAHVILNMTSHERENSINQQTINETCLQLNRNLDGLQELYKLYVKGGRWSPKELLQDVFFNINTDQNMTTVCLELPMDTIFPTNITRAHSNLVGGPIQNLTLLNDSCLVWRRESKSAELYVISANGHRYHQKDFKHMLIFNVSIDEPHPVICLELKKETNYTVELMSVSYSQYPAQINILSTISEHPPSKVKIVPVNSQLPKISFRRSDNNEHIGSYQVFVIQSMSWCSFTCESLEAVTYFSNISKMQGYVTAEFFPGDTPEHLELLIGDRQYYGDFYNAPLERGKDYCIILRTVSKMKTHTCIVMAEIKELSTSRHHMTVVLLGSVALAFFILLISYSMARCCNR
ncbi:sushi domain-containing protein 1 isoform X2 [Aquarana catesbeiana]|uniref:sushi domain-containing protein 1 isoform X2 n=1 Tax=Aquarana catesbeiana TaxID=8400 RepID=UPI003CC9F653